jgi:ketosteroid isomerase-like protein
MVRHNMSIAKTANTYVNLCKEGKFDECLTELYSKDAVSVEAWAPPGVQLVASGLQAIRAKGKAWADDHEVHRIEVSGPYPNDQRFAVRFSFDVTSAPTKKRLTMDEIGLFTVENGKIVREEFFYSGG